MYVLVLLFKPVITLRVSDIMYSLSMVNLVHTLHTSYRQHTHVIQFTLWAYNLTFWQHYPSMCYNHKDMSAPELTNVPI